jgi:hypothetical protein
MSKIGYLQKDSANPVAFYTHAVKNYEFDLI